MGQRLFRFPGYCLSVGGIFRRLIAIFIPNSIYEKEGLLVKPKWAWKDEGVTKVRKLMIPALFGVSVTQLNLLLNQVIASFLITGSISWMYYADRLIEFPLGLFGIAISTVVLPSLSRIAKNKELTEIQRGEHFQNTMDWG